MSADQDGVLRETLVKVRDRIVDGRREHGDRLSEQDTKAVLIDPILKALGWRLDELADVRREYRVKPQDNPVDYALFVYGQPQLFVEAKALSHPLDRKSAAQVLGYAAVVGVGWCLVTNGDEYRLYNSHAQVDVDEKLFRSWCLSNPEQTQFSLETLALIAREQIGDTLDLLWKSQFVDRRVKRAVSDLFGDSDGGFAQLVHKRTTDLSLVEVRESLRRAKLEVHYPALGRSFTSTGAAAAQASQPVTTALPEAVADSTVKSLPSRHSSYAVNLQDLIAAGLIQPPLALEKMYKGVEFRATVEVDGRISLAGESYASLSTAAGMARKSVIGTPDGRSFPQTDGWDFWRYRDAASGELRLIDNLRQQYRRREHA